MPAMDTSHAHTHIVCGRFAPTPSGRMHLGNAFAALMAWLAVRSEGGRLVLRIEDLDPRAQVPERATAVMDDLRWLGLDWDEGPLWQSTRMNVYEEALCTLNRAKLTYPCFCTRAELHAAHAPHTADGSSIYQGRCRHLSPEEVVRLSAHHPPAIRLRVPPEDDPLGTIHVDDLVYGAHDEVLARDCGDFLIRRSDGVFAYQLAVVVDDAAAGVTLVVRGRDLLGSTARQMYLARLLGYAPPRYGHIPLLMAPDGRRLSKREHDLTLGALRSMGIRPERILGMLGHAVGFCEENDATLDELIASFSWDTLRAHHEDICVDNDFFSALCAQ